MNAEELTDRALGAMAGFAELLGAVAEERWEAPTPCAEWTVRDLVEHTVGLTAGVADALQAGDASPAAYRPRPASWWPRAVSALARAMWSTETSAGQVRVFPVSDQLAFTAPEVARIHLLDVITHSWDLARALGLDYDPGETASELVDLAALVAGRGLPALVRDFGPPVVSQENGSGDWAGVLRLLGRDPGWQPAAPVPAEPGLAPVDVAERLTRFSELWSPKIVARLNGHEVKVVKMSGAFDWHTHHDTDELFLVMTGRLRIEMRHGSVRLGPGDLYVVPRGVAHRPVATVPIESILLEPVGVVNTGDAGGPLTAVDEVLL
jgi:uncharacterized protein (TIGR03086 family)